MSIINRIRTLRSRISERAEEITNAQEAEQRKHAKECYEDGLRRDYEKFKKGEIDKIGDWGVYGQPVADENGNLVGIKTAKRELTLDEVSSEMFWNAEHDGNDSVEFRRLARIREEKLKKNRPEARRQVFKELVGRSKGTTRR